MVAERGRKEESEERQRRARKDRGERKGETVRIKKQLFMKHNSHAAVVPSTRLLPASVWVQNGMKECYAVFQGNQNMSAVEGGGRLKVGHKYVCVGALTSGSPQREEL